MIRKATLSSSRPRNPLVRALYRLGRGLGTRRHKAASERRRRQLDRMDLDDRVREVGEW